MGLDGLGDYFQDLVGTGLSDNVLAARGRPLRGDELMHARVGERPAPQTGSAHQSVVLSELNTFRKLLESEGHLGEEDARS